MPIPEKMILFFLKKGSNSLEGQEHFTVSLQESLGKDDFRVTEETLKQVLKCTGVKTFS